jgi:gamma-glutamylputrescine oxidase
MIMTAHSSPWKNEKQRYPRLNDELLVDVAIVGGGVAGIGVAYALSKTNKSVALLEANTLASGLSGLGSGAMVGGADLDFWQMVEWYGPREAVAWLRETYAMRREIIRVIKQNRLDVDIDQTGSLMFALHEKDLPVLEQEARLRKKYGFRSTLIRGAALEKMVKVKALAGLYVPDDTLIIHSKLVLGFAKLCSTRVRLFEQTPVHRLKQQGKKFILETPEGRVYASKIVLAASKASSKLAPELPEPPKVAVCSAITRKLTSAELRSIGWHKAHMFWNMGSDYTMARLMPDRRILMTGDRIPSLEPFFRQIFPQLKHVMIERSWAGLVDTPKDMRPLVGRRGNLFYSYGLTSHGLINAFVNGKKIVKLMG